MKYYNEKTRHNGRIYRIRLNGEPAYLVKCHKKNGACYQKIWITMEAAIWDMEQHGYRRKGIIDETGCARYTMTEQQLQTLYKQLENFVADCTQEEYNENKQAITAVYALIHKHINAEINK